MDNTTKPQDWYLYKKAIGERIAKGENPRTKWAMDTGC